MTWRLLKFDGQNVILEHEDGTVAEWPKEYFPAKFDIGDKVNITFHNSTELQGDDKEKKDIINTLLESS